MKKNILWMLATILCFGAICNVGFSAKGYACEDCDDSDNDHDKGWF